RQVSVLFWINVGISLLVAGLFAGLSPLIAAFYDEPRVIAITIVMSLSFIVAGLSSQHMAILRRHMRYKTLAWIQIAAMLASIGVAIGMALAGFGYWALVGLALGQGVAKMILAWVFSPWLPGLIFKAEDMGGLIKFGANMTAFNFTNYFTRNADNLMLGATWGATILGLYSKAYGLLLLPMKQVNAPIASVAVPSLSRLQDEPERFGTFYCRMLQVACYISMPMVVLFIILSKEAVLVLMGEQWMESVPIFRALSILALGQTVQNSTGWVMIAYNRTGRMFKWSILQGSCAVVAFSIGLSWGGYGVAVAAAICGMTLLVPGLAYAYHDTPVKLSSVGKVLIRPLAFSAIIFASAGPARYAVQDMHLVLRILLPVLAAGAAAGLTVLLWKQLRLDLVNIKNVLKKKQK
ncbi:MAG: lipopolysaccharide biosynthesis protein, partial [Planctomycetota bacterium]